MAISILSSAVLKMSECEREMERLNENTRISTFRAFTGKSADAMSLLTEFSAFHLGHMVARRLYMPGKKMGKFFDSRMTKHVRPGV